MNFVLYKNVSLKVTIISKYSTDFILTKFAPHHFFAENGFFGPFPTVCWFYYIMPNSLRLSRGTRTDFSENARYPSFNLCFFCSSNYLWLIRLS